MLSQDSSAPKAQNGQKLTDLIAAFDNVKQNLERRLQSEKNQAQRAKTNTQNEVIIQDSETKRAKLAKFSTAIHDSSDSITIPIKQEGENAVQNGQATNVVKAAPPLEFLERSLSHQSLRSFSELCGIQTMTDSLNMSSMSNTAENHSTVTEKQKHKGEDGSSETGKENSPTKYTEEELQNAYMNSSDIEQIDLGSFLEQPGYYKNSFQYKSLFTSNENSNSVESVEQNDSNQQNPLPLVVSCNMTPKALYLTLDVQRNESVGEKEIKRALKCLRIPVSSSIVRKTYEACDKNGDGKISMDEFVQYLKEREAELKEMFNKMDLSKDGYVTLEELKAAREMGLFEASDEEIKSLIEWMDNLHKGRKDGKIDYEEFRTSMVLFPPATTIQEIIYCLRNKKE